MMQQPLRLALVGAGVFARDAHLPALQSLPDHFELVAVYSRTRATAERLVANYDSPLDVVTDLDALLAREDVDAVDVVLPINAMPDAVEKALRAGKHVVSEKPMAPTVARGQALLACERSDRVWMVAENYRYIKAYAAAAEILASGRLGRPLLCHWAAPSVLAPDNKYYQTDWRRSGDLPGGFLLDGGVHYAAALRMILGEVRRVTAFSALMRPDLPPVDTMAASLEFESGALGTLSVTYAAATASERTITIYCERGTIQVKREQIEIDHDGDRDVLEYVDHSIPDQLAAFADAVRHGTSHRNSAVEGLRDVALVEALLTAAQTGHAVEPAVVG